MNKTVSRGERLFWIESTVGTTYTVGVIERPYGTNGPSTTGTFTSTSSWYENTILTSGWAIGSSAKSWIRSAEASLRERALAKIPYTCTSNTNFGERSLCWTHLWLLKRLLIEVHVLHRDYDTLFSYHLHNYYKQQRKFLQGSTSIRSYQYIFSTNQIINALIS